MHDDQNKIDELFSRKLTNFESEPSFVVWEKLENDLKKKRRTVFWLWMTRTGIAATLLLAFGTGWFFATRQQSKQNHTSEIVENNKKIEPSSPIPQVTTMAAPEVKTGPIANNEPESIVIQNFKNKTALSFQAANGPAGKENLEPSTTFRKDEPISAGRLTFKRVFATKPSENYSLAAIKRDQTMLSEEDQAIIAANLRQQPQNKPNDRTVDKRWSLGAQISPTQQYNEILAFSSNNDYAYEPPEASGVPTTTSGYDVNMTGGINVSYQASRRLSFQSGMNFNTISQNSSEIPVSFAGHNWISNLGDAYYQNISNAPVKKVNSSNHQTAINTQMGIANLALPVGTEVAVINNRESNYTEWAENYRFSQRSNYLEIPFTARYQLIGNKLGLHLLGGLNANILISNEAKLLSSQDILASGKIENLRPLTFSSSMGVGMNYGLSERFMISLEPVLKIMLNDMNSDSDFEVRPYTFGLFTGLNYRF